MDEKRRFEVEYEVDVFSVCFTGMKGEYFVFGVGCLRNLLKHGIIPIRYAADADTVCVGDKCLDFFCVVGDFSGSCKDDTVN